MTQLPPHRGDDADALLLERARAGDSDAFGELYRREVDPARRLARVLVGDDAADELVAESFAKVLAQLQAGRGPTDDFRAYLHVTVRNGFRDGLRAPKESPSSDQPWLLDDVLPPVEEIVEDLDRDVAVTALATLPKSWQQVLWHLEVEGRKPAEVAALLDMDAGAVSSLAYRAREGLKRAYLDQQFVPSTAGECGWTQSRMSQYVRGDLSPRAQQKVADHIDSCAECAAAFASVDRVNKKLGAWLFPVVLWGIVGAKKGGLLWFAGATGIGAAGAGGTTSGGSGTTSGAASNPVVLGAAAAVVAAAVVGGLALALSSGDDDPGGRDGSSADGPADPGDPSRDPRDPTGDPDPTNEPRSTPPAGSEVPAIAPTEVPTETPTTEAPPVDPSTEGPPTNPPTSKPPTEPPTSEPPTQPPTQPPTKPPPIVVVPKPPIVIAINVCGLVGSIQIGGIAINAGNPIIEIGGIRYELHGNGEHGAFSIEATALLGFVIADGATTLFQGNLGIYLPCLGGAAA